MLKHSFWLKVFVLKLLTKNVDAQGEEKSKGYVLLKLKHQVEAV